MADEKMIKVRVAVPAREGFQGFYAGGRFFANGTAEYEVPAKDLEQLKRESETGFFALVELSKDSLETPEEKQMAADLEKQAGLSDHDATATTENRPTRRR